MSLTFRSKQLKDVWHLTGSCMTTVIKEDFRINICPISLLGANREKNIMNVYPAKTSRFKDGLGVSTFCVVLLGLDKQRAWIEITSEGQKESFSLPT